MKITVDKKDLVCMVRGITPHQDVFDHPLVKQCGQWHDAIDGYWYWFGTLILEKLTMKELYELYTICKKSWE